MLSQIYTSRNEVHFLFTSTTHLLFSLGQQWHSSWRKTPSTACTYFTKAAIWSPCSCFVLVWHSVRRVPALRIFCLFRLRWVVGAFQSYGRLWGFGWFLGLLIEFWWRRQGEVHRRCRWCWWRRRRFARCWCFGCLCCPLCRGPGCWGRGCREGSRWSCWCWRRLWAWRCGWERRLGWTVAQPQRQGQEAQAGELLCYMEMPIWEVVLVYRRHQELLALAPEFGADSQ